MRACLLATACAWFAVTTDHMTHDSCNFQVIRFMQRRRAGISRPTMAAWFAPGLHHAAKNSTNNILEILSAPSWRHACVQLSCDCALNSYTCKLLIGFLAGQAGTTWSPHWSALGGICQQPRPRASQQKHASVNRWHLCVVAENRST